MKFRDFIFTVLGVLIGILIIRLRLVILLEVYAVFFLASFAKNVTTYIHNRYIKRNKKGCA